MVREYLICEEMLRQKRSFFGCVRERLAPVKHCDKLEGEVPKIPFPCENCTVEADGKWPLHSKQLFFPPGVANKVDRKLAEKAYENVNKELDEQAYEKVDEKLDKKLDEKVCKKLKKEVDDKFLENVAQKLNDKAVLSKNIPVTPEKPQPPPRRIKDAQVPKAPAPCKTHDGKHNDILICGNWPNCVRKAFPATSPTLYPRPVHRVSSRRNLRHAFRKPLSDTDSIDEVAKELLYPEEKQLPP